jgi:hypothetical protein
VSRCLSDKALMRLGAELGSAAEQAHLDTCATCAARQRTVSEEVDKIRQVLLTTPEPVGHTVPRPRRSLVALAGLATLAMAALVWIEVAAWKTIQPTEDLTSVEQVEAALADVTAAIFSVDGEPTPIFGENSTVTGLDQDDGPDIGCEEPWWLDDAECSDTMQSFEEPQDSIDISTERTAFDRDSVDQGG